jgi:hypothetical protein
MTLLTSIQYELHIYYMLILITPVNEIIISILLNYTFEQQHILSIIFLIFFWLNSTFGLLYLFQILTWFLIF